MNHQPEFFKQIQQAGQGHILRFWNELPEPARERLLNQIRTIDFTLLARLIEEHLKSLESAVAHKKLEPTGVITLPETTSAKKRRAEARQAGEAALRQGKVACLLVAGGQASRLGYDGPKGAFKVGPISGKSLFQLFGERILALNRIYHTQIPWYIMTSETNDGQTRDFFAQNRFFGLPEDMVGFFKQMMMPAVDFNGRLILSDKGNIFMNPAGNGVCPLALKKSGALEAMQEEEIEHVFYFQVDNALANIADPVFIGYHILDQTEVSTKVVAKLYPEEKMGVVGQINGRFGIIEYSELSEEQMYARKDNGSLRFGYGTIGIYVFSREFLEKVAEGFNLPFHAARKAIPCLDESGGLIQPTAPNGIKFETFIFDMLPQAGKASAIEVVREEEYLPLKNKEGENSPTTVTRGLINLYALWLEAAEIKVPRDDQGEVAGVVEISPIFALDRESFVEKVDKNITFDGRLYIEG
ncbi:MAG: UDPGP type 1 family protein [bacterium]